MRNHGNHSISSKVMPYLELRQRLISLHSVWLTYNGGILLKRHQKKINLLTDWSLNKTAAILQNTLNDFFLTQNVCICIWVITKAWLFLTNILNSVIAFWTGSGDGLALIGRRAIISKHWHIVYWIIRNDIRWHWNQNVEVFFKVLSWIHIWKCSLHFFQALKF